MADLLQTGVAWLTGQLAAHAAQSVTYARANSTATVNATLGRKLLQIADVEGGIRMEWTDLDVIVPASELVLAAVAVTPARGDKITITDTIAHKARTYQVEPYGDEPPWTWADPHRTLVRIHTKFLSEASIP
jgi:hypothetical protein